MTKTAELKLTRAAQAAARNAYARFSKLRVGAAVLAASGRVYKGANVENSSYGLTVCAERVAVFNAVSAGERAVKAIAVFARTKEPTPPCGACLQVIGEFGDNPDVVLTNGRKSRNLKLRDLLPCGFRLKKRT